MILLFLHDDPNQMERLLSDPEKIERGKETYGLKIIAVETGAVEDLDIYFKGPIKTKEHRSLFIRSLLKSLKNIIDIDYMDIDKIIAFVRHTNLLTPTILQQIAVL